MIKKLYSILIVAVLFSCSTYTDTENNSNNVRDPLFRPADGKKILFIGQDLETINGYLSADLKKPAGFISYTNPDDLNGISKSVDWGYGTVHSDSLINHPDYQNSKKPYIAIGFYMVGMVDNLLNGNYYDNMIEFANWIKASETAVFLRIGYEFNSSWAGYTPESYKEAFKYIVDLFNEQNVENCAYVWQTDGFWDISRETLDSYYPGDHYVDWCAYSHFGADGVPYTELISFAQDHNKPIMVAESAPVLDKPGRIGWDVESDTDVIAEWYEPFFTLINSTPEIQAVCYINADWSNQDMWKSNDYFKNTDGRIEKGSEELKNFWNNQFDENWILRKPNN